MPEPIVSTGELNTAIPAAATPVAPTEVEVTLGDKSFKVSKEVADALTAVQKSSGESVETLTSKVEELEAAIKAARPTPVPADEEELDVNQLFVNPKKFLDEYAAKIKADLVTAYTQTTNQDKFWQAFYEKHAELKPHDFYVKAVLSREMKGLSNLSVEKAITKLGDTVKGELLKLSGKSGKGGKPTTEGGTEHVVRESKEDDSEDSPTEPKPGGGLVGLLKARREARRQGSTLQARVKH